MSASDSVSGNTAGPPFGISLLAALAAAAPHLSDAQQAMWRDALLAPMASSGITTPSRMAIFLSQCAVESGGFSQLEEQLFYTASRLCQVWPSRFRDEASARVCAGHPEMLANMVYAGRMGNGDAASGDGWRFRGRGLIQLTGRDNYTRFALAIRKSLDDTVAYVATPSGAAQSACWYWSTRSHLQNCADCWDVAGVTRTINGGLQDLGTRSLLAGRVLDAVQKSQR